MTDMLDNGDEAPWPPVRVRKGDWIVADENGVVCVPVEDMEKVKEMAKKSRDIDERCALDIKAGKGIEETFKKHRES
jgi:regulator of RNase E activity RraA